ncbi:MAG: hypothetical protein IJZ47_07860 [Oscillospiraceae bacterium]|nr:hypothetical protein [Oscillospiraceae bacterium]
MNKQEFKSAYNKITLSDEFKAAARAKLTEQFGKAEEQITDNVTEERASTVMAIAPKKRSPWKSIIGIGSAAAVVGLGIWGGSVWLDRTQNPLDGQQTTEVSETIETNEAVDITSDMQLHRITFPAYYYDLDSKLYNPAMDMEPFVFTIALPQEWDIFVPDDEDDMMGTSMVFIMDGKECVGAIDCDIYKDLTGDEYGFEDVEYGHPDYHQMVLMDLMNAEYRVYPEGWDYDFINGEKRTDEWIMQPFDIDTVEDYAEIKTDGSMTAASCTLYRYMADPAYINTLFYGSGVIAYDSATHTYVYACFADELDEKLLSNITESIAISSTTLTEHSMVFPAYYDKLEKNNIDIFSAVPFKMDISLPEGWELMIPESEDRGGFSMVQILDEDGSVIGSMDFNVYEKYEGMEYGAPDYYRMVFNQLMLGSVINWDTDYTEVKTDGWMKSATCKIGFNSPDGRADDTEYTSGILAYEDDLGVYVNISFNSLLDEKLHSDIAKSVVISESTIGLAERLADLVLELEGIRILGPNGFTDIAVTAVDTPCGTYVGVAYPDQVVTEGYDGMSVDRTLSMYSIHDNRLNGISFRSDGWICSFSSSDSVFMYENGEDILFVEEKTVDGYKTITYKKFHPEECAFEELTYFRIVRNESGTYAIKFDDGYDGYLETHMTEAQYNEAVGEIMDGYNLAADLPCQPEDMTKNIATYYQSVVDVIEEALLNMDKQPVEEPFPMPPNIFLDAAGAERPLLMGSYTWGEGLDEMHHDGYTIEDIKSPDIGYVYPATWFEDARLVVPEGGVITSVTLHKDAQTYTELEYTADGAIILPHDPIGEHIKIIVEYPEGACAYLMSVDFPETSAPPAVTLDGAELTLGSYIWNGDLSEDHPKNADVYQMFLDGELLTVTDTYTVDVTLPEEARLIEAVCLGAHLDTQMQLGSEEYGRVYLPTANAKSDGIVRLSVEYPDGSVSYWLGFRHETQSSIPEALTATADGVEFTLREGTGDWSDETLYRLENNAHHIEVGLPAGCALTDARAINAEAGEHELIWTDDGLILMPYYDTQLIRVTVTFAQGEGVYWFIYKTESAPTLTAFANGSSESFQPFCGYWGWEYVVWEAADDGFGWQQAFELYRNGGQLPYLLDAEYFELALPEYTRTVTVRYYDENGTSKDLPPDDDNGVYYMPDTELALIKVSISCYGGICEYWFAHVIGVCGNEEMEEHTSP